MNNSLEISNHLEISNFTLVCYFNKDTNDLVRIEQYRDDDTSIQSDIDSYKYGYNTKIIKPETLFYEINKKDNLHNHLINVNKKYKRKLEDIENICRTVNPTGLDEETDKFWDILDIIEE